MMLISRYHLIRSYILNLEPISEKVVRESYNDETSQKRLSSKLLHNRLKQSTTFNSYLVEINT